MTHQHIASLPWYDGATSRAALDAFWTTLRGELAALGVPALPGNLNRTLPVATQWQHSDLLLSQCCGLDLFGSTTGSLVPFARPVFCEPGCGAGTYHSLLVSTHTQLAGRIRVAVNSLSSHSGATALCEWLGAAGLAVDELLLTGSHTASMRAIRRGGSDLAAIDVHAFEQLDADGVYVLGCSLPAPTPPFVTSKASSIPVDVLYTGLERTIDRIGDSIGIRELLPADRALYQTVQQRAAVGGSTLKDTT